MVAELVISQFRIEQAASQACERGNFNMCETTFPDLLLNVLAYRIAHVLDSSKQVPSITSALISEVRACVLASISRSDHHSIFRSKIPTVMVFSRETDTSSNFEAAV